MAQNPDTWKGETEKQRNSEMERNGHRPERMRVELRKRDRDSGRQEKRPQERWRQKLRQKGDEDQEK
jgi:hypothetical protein